MSYDRWRALAVRNVYSNAVRRLLPNYRLGAPTVVLLPGGMGSQLDRSLDAYRTPRDPPPTDYDTVWLDAGVLFNQDALTLEIDGRGHDKDGHAIVPNGPLDFLISAYDRTEKFFADLGWNYLTFAFDWRRSLVEGTSYLELFLSLYREAVWRKHRENPLPRTSLVAHSQGGLVAKLFLHRVVDLPSWNDKVITVATPFYGTASQQARYFVGEPVLNNLYGAAAVARIVGTLPGPYIHMFLDRETFERDGARLGLRSYPVVDAETGADADPYDPADLERYPDWVRARYLNDAKRLRQTITKPLSEPVQQRVFTIRSRKDERTPTALAWRRIEDEFDPDTDESPITVESTEFGGDGTVPGWAAWLPDLPDGNRIDLETASDHTLLMEHVEVLEIIRGIISEGRVPAEREMRDELYGGAPASASRDDVEDFVREVGDGRANRDDPRAQDPALWRGFMRELKR